MRLAMIQRNWRSTDMDPDLTRSAQGMVIVQNLWTRKGRPQRIQDTSRRSPRSQEHLLQARKQSRSDAHTVTWSSQAAEQVIANTARELRRPAQKLQNTTVRRTRVELGKRTCSAEANQAGIHAAKLICTSKRSTRQAANQVTTSIRPRC